MVFGTFDILHPGHLDFFRQAKKFGDYLIVVVALDETVKKVKNCLPQNNENVRVNTVKKAQIANKIVLGGKGDKYEIIRKYNPNIICLGYDQKFFIDNLKKEFPKIKIVRLNAYKPKIYKSSKLSEHI